MAMAKTNMYCLKTKLEYRWGKWSRAGGRQCVQSAKPQNIVLSCHVKLSINHSLINFLCIWQENFEIPIRPQCVNSVCINQFNSNIPYCEGCAKELSSKYEWCMTILSSKLRSYDRLTICKMLTKFTQCCIHAVHSFTNYRYSVAMDQFQIQHICSFELMVEFSQEEFQHCKAYWKETPTWLGNVWQTEWF